jgi:glucan 1,4-alpha-glucosidase
MRNFVQPAKVKMFLPFYFCLFTCLSFAQTLAPGAPGNDAQWATAGKQAIGTSASLDSKVWFTLADGVLTEVYYPDVTVANVHLLQFVVVNPKTKKVETERDDATHEIKVLRPDSLSFQQINTAESGEWKITKTYTTDIERNSILISVDFETNNKNLKIYLYYDPSLANTGMKDTAWSEGNVMYSQEADKTSALLVGEGDADKQFKKIDEKLLISNGFYGASDGLEQLRENGRLSSIYNRAENGNVVQMAEIRNKVYPRRPSGPIKPLKNDFSLYNTGIELILSFGKSAKDALETAEKTAEKGFKKSQAEYEKGWSYSVKALPKVEAKYQAQFYMAAMVLKAQEDKTVRGANVASLTIPWGGGKNANEDVGGGYHLVWARDLYQVFTAYLALGDTAAANRALDFLFNIQQKADGSFPQNSWLDGRNGWGGLQMDEVGYPLIMAYQLKRFDKQTYENHVKKAADFLVKNGPKTPQERWEEKGGYSPSTIAAEIAGLVCAAEIARKNNDETSANLWLKTADDWQSNIEKWTATTNGKFGDGNYYIRLTANGKPDAGEKIELSNSSGAFPENEIVDAGFLELVRLGIKSPDDPLIQKSVKVIDQVLKVSTPNGESFYRYNHDGYGEQPDGRRWNFDGTYSGTGRLWALLAGERGQYEIAFAEKLQIAALESEKQIESKGPNCRSCYNAEQINLLSDSREKTIERNKTLAQAQARLDAMANFANEGLMIPEQIWDKAETPKNIDRQFVPELKFGEGTGSATPLAWSMAQFIRLAVNLQAGKNLDTPDVVYNRYVMNNKSAKTLSYQNPDSISLKEPKDVVTQTDVNCFKEMSDHKKYENVAVFPQIKQCKNKMAYAVFAYRGEAKNVQIVGDFTNWESRNWTLRLDEQFVGKDKTKYASFSFNPSARVEYKLIVDGKWISDPLNPNKVDNGVGGENSFFTMPDYKATTWDAETNDAPKLETLEIDSKIYGKRIVQVYQPMSEEGSAAADGLSSQKRKLKINAPVAQQSVNTSDDGKMPTLYLQDGSDYINRAKAIQIQQNLVKANKIKPFILVFLDPKDRMKEYWANDDYARFLATEVVPAIEAKYNTIKSRDGRAVLGASLGGITSVWVGLKYPEIFSRIGGQSSSFWVDDERVVKELEKLDANKTNYKFYFDDGTLEGVEDSRKVVELLRKKSFDVTYVEGEAGHNWTSWRDRLADAFVSLMN